MKRNEMPKKPHHNEAVECLRDTAPELTDEGETVAATRYDTDETAEGRGVDARGGRRTWENTR